VSEFERRWAEQLLVHMGVSGPAPDTLGQARNILCRALVLTGASADDVCERMRVIQKEEDD